MRPGEMEEPVDGFVQALPRYSNGRGTGTPGGAPSLSPLNIVSPSHPGHGTFGMGLPSHFGYPSPTLHQQHSSQYQVPSPHLQPYQQQQYSNNISPDQQFNPQDQNKQQGYFPLLHSHSSPSHSRTVSTEQQFLGGHQQNLVDSWNQDLQQTQSQHHHQTMSGRSLNGSISNLTSIHTHPHHPSNSMDSSSSSLNPSPDSSSSSGFKRNRSAMDENSFHVENLPDLNSFSTSHRGLSSSGNLSMEVNGTRDEMDQNDRDMKRSRSFTGGELGPSFGQI